MIRSHTQWIDEGERSTKYFCAFETKKFLDKKIKKYSLLKRDNNGSKTYIKGITNILRRALRKPRC